MGHYGSDEGISVKVIKPDQSSLLSRVISTIAISTTLCMMQYDTVALDGVIPLLQRYFVIADSTTALLQTLSTITSSIALVCVGIIGDRIEKRSFVLVAISSWTLLNGLALLVPSSMFWLFLLLRTLADIGHSIAGSLTPVILSDFYKDKHLGRALVTNTLVVFMGSLISSSITSIFLTSGLPWQTALTPSIAFILPLFIVLFCNMPQSPSLAIRKSRGYIGDVKYLLSIKSFLFLIGGASMASIFGKAVAFWMPTALFYAFISGGEAVFGSVPYAGVMTLKSILALSGSLVAIPLLTFVAESWEFGGRLCCGRKFQRTLPVMIVILQTTAGVFIFLNLFTLNSQFMLNLPIHFFLTFFGAPMASLMPQLVMRIAPRGQRATAYALMSLISGLAGSPAAQIAGMISDAYRQGSEDAATRFFALRFALLIFLGVFYTGTIFYCLICVYYPDDVKRKEMDEESENLLNNNESSVDERRERGGSVLERAILSRRATMETVYA